MSSSIITNRTDPHPLAATPDRSTGLDAPFLPLRAFLDLAGQLLRGLPETVWLEATIVASKAGRSGHTLELVEAGAPVGQGGALRVFLAGAVLDRISSSIGGPVEAGLLVGMTTVLKVSPQWSSRYHLGARVLDLGRDTTQSLAQKRLEQLRQALRREGLYDRQRRLPMPRDVTRVAIVHPAGAAGYADIAATLARWEGAGLLVIRSHAVPFEGASAPQALATALRAAVEPLAGSRPDLVLMVRGGGSRAGLAVLDHETIVRAVALCPVPIACGLGHAIDNDLLLCEIAWRNLDTPSKALACVAELMRAPARQVRGALEAITSLAGQRLQAEEIRLQAYRSGLTAQGGRCLTGAEADVDRVFAEVRIAIGAAGARCRQAMSDLRHMMAALHATVPLRIDAAARASRDLRVQVSSGMRMRLSAIDPGEPAWRSVVQAAGTQLHLQAAGLRPLRDAVGTAATTSLDRSAAALVAAEAIVAAASPETVLARGFALVRGPDGRVIRTVAAAHEAHGLTLHLHDGDVAAVVEA
ncbi:exodeoxyribonuclease VII large subunit [Lichenihabitans sp. Uapishka_5]|uniref:exodeoxyribonuclease VII large subunit n=1 Tax=Lichenihabitans sp. Uapishka_5 TaxID=3037302 RepID=UPI0029E7CF13|nr:exodeoxyribonuclease VII large subunit [Lichenihabitans sp. Uapishka_5]MDX7949740.1 exodeoxyribonuclease VII large subunit [Lichenihabitans sp. Uapishka_5]